MGPTVAAESARVCGVQAFLRTCQCTVICRDRRAIGVGQLDLDRELHLAVRVEAPEQFGLALAQGAGGGDRPAGEFQVGDLGGPGEGRDLAHPLRERAHERGAGGRLAGGEQRAGVLRSDMVVQPLVVGQANHAAPLADLGHVEPEVTVEGDRLLEPLR